MFHSLKKSIICIAGIFSFAITSQVWAEDFSVTYVDYSGSNCPADVVDIVKAQGLKFKFSTVDYQKMRLLSAETNPITLERKLI